MLADACRGARHPGLRRARQPRLAPEPDATSSIAVLGEAGVHLLERESARFGSAGSRSAWSG